MRTDACMHTRAYAHTCMRTHMHTPSSTCVIVGVEAPPLVEREGAPHWIALVLSR